MKIGVVTYWYGNSNYGMILQCWALQQYLRKLGHEPYVIRYKPEEPLWKRVARRIFERIVCATSSEKKEQLKASQNLKFYNEIKDEERKFEDFRCRYLRMSQLFYSNINALRNEPPIADCYIAGSDQIWSNNLKGKGSWGYFLGFGHSAIKRISYAPSFGTLKYGENEKYLLKKALSVFDAISCRENEGVKTCREIGYESVKVEDPTLLLTGKDYEPLIEKIEQSNHIFIYSVNMRSADDIFWDSIKNFFSLENIIVTPSSGSIMGGELFGQDVKYIYATVGEWLSLIRNAKMVVTSSFHGIVFSIIFNVKFAFVPLKGGFAKTNNRITDLLKSLQLEDLIVSSPEDYMRIYDSHIDWAEVNKRKERLIVESSEFLFNALNKEKASSN